MAKNNRKAFLFLLLGGIFLCNPFFALIDIFPDFLGFLFLVVGLESLSEKSQRLEEAKADFGKLLWIGLSELFFAFLIYGFLNRSEETMNRYEVPTWMLLLSFSVGVLECVFLLPALRTYFAGMEHLAELSEDAPNANGWRKLSHFTVWFTVLRAVLTVLPEACILISYGRDAGRSRFGFSWYDFVEMFRIFALIPVLVLGIIWGIRYWKLLRSLRKIGGLDEKFGEKSAEKPQKERICLSFKCFAAGLLFAVPLTLEYREVFPDWLCGLALAMGVFLNRRFFRIPKAAYIAFSGLLTVGIAETVFHTAFLKKYTPEDVLHLTSAYQAHLPVLILGILETVAVTVVIGYLFLCLRDLIRRWISVDYENDEDASRRATQKEQRSLCLKMIPAIAAVLLTGIGKIADLLFGSEYGWIRWIPFVTGLAALILFSDFLGELRENLFGDRAE